MQTLTLSFSSLRKLGLALAVCGALATPSLAELVIKPGDIKNGRYLYKLEKADMQALAPETGKLPDWDWEPTGNKFFDDVHSFSNLRMTTGHWSFIQMKPGASSAEFVYRFDFSKTGQRPTSMRLREVVRHEQDGGTYEKRAATSFASFYRVGETGDWLPLHASEPGVGFRGDQSYLSEPIKLGGSPAVVFYKVVFASDRPITGSYLKKGDKNGNDGRGGPLWNMTRPDQPDNFFQVVFQTAPAGGGR